MSEVKTSLQMNSEHFDKLLLALYGLRRIIRSFKSLMPAHVAENLESLVTQAVEAVVAMEIVKDDQVATTDHVTTAEALK